VENCLHISATCEEQHSQATEIAGVTYWTSIFFHL